MNVDITAYTPDPIHHISRCAGLCYNKTDNNPGRVERCVAMGHTSILEHASVSFVVDGISRACSHQLVRHRIASYNQQSQRYCRMNDARFVCPPSVQNYVNREDVFYQAIEACQDAYATLLALGVKPEDARYVLPESCTTKVATTMNWREIFHFLDLRTDRAAQWEIRNFANALVAAMDEIDDLKPMVALWRKNKG